MVLKMKNTNRNVGYGIIALGVVLLVVTFALALNALLNPGFLEGFQDLVSPGDEGFGALIDMLIFIIPVLILFVLGSIAGKITKYGLNMIKIPDPKGAQESSGSKKSAKTQRSPQPSPQPPAQPKSSQRSRSPSSKAENGRPPEPRPEPEEQK